MVLFLDFIGFSFPRRVACFQFQSSFILGILYALSTDFQSRFSAFDNYVFFKSSTIFHSGPMSLVGGHDDDDVTMIEQVVVVLRVCVGPVVSCLEW